MKTGNNYSGMIRTDSVDKGLFRCIIMIKIIKYPVINHNGCFMSCLLLTHTEITYNHDRH
jgi:hypothetical protein